MNYCELVRLVAVSGSRPRSCLPAPPPASPPAPPPEPAVAGPWRLEPQRPPLALPLAAEAVAAGFPSPADDYMEAAIDLNEVLIRHPSSTFFLRVSGDSMIGAGIHHGDLLIVDRSLEPRPGRIVVAVLEGAFTLKRLVRQQGRWLLEAAHPAYPLLELGAADDDRLWGVAIHVIHPL
ncbi:translesion error-prone DNA polymerase V autoproteolytic subunit [Synechococcus sp. CBW1002]|nr:translesion error-prone DNA polymerase V autoproteolytic subunit [Synechococcus sp. CBW1002]QPN66024.1 translesion error-prone DNA polymerase V autoproteolytic subunit [Synechococcus sp. CBW1006]